MNLNPIKKIRYFQLFQEEKWLALTGLLGFVLAGVCGVWTLVFGAEVSPGGDVSKAFSFNAAMGIFLLTTAMLSPLSAMGKKGRFVFRWSYIPLVLYSYGAETIQNFRGVNPRFVENGSFFDETVASGFALVALLLVIVYLFLAVQYFRRKAYRQHPTMVLGIRYAMIAVFFSFAGGIWISVNLGSSVGLDGNMIWFHGLGFHALQAVPLVAWISERTSISLSARRKCVHVTGVSYLLGLTAIGYQTLLGYSLSEWSVLPILAGACFLVSIAVGGWVLQKCIINGFRKEPFMMQNQI